MCSRAAQEEWVPLARYGAIKTRNALSLNHEPPVQFGRAVSWNREGDCSVLPSSGRNSSFGKVADARRLWRRGSKLSLRPSPCTERINPSMPPSQYLRLVHMPGGSEQLEICPLEQAGEAPTG